MTTMTTNRSSKLMAALKARFSSPQAVLTRLGLDADLLAPAASGGNSDPVKKMRIAIEDLFGKLDLDEKQIKRVLEVLDEHSDPRKLDDSDPYKERSSELAGDDQFEEVRDFLKGLGLSAIDIEEAIKIARGAENGATDRLPVSGPGGQGGYRSGRERMPGESVFATDERRRGRRPAAMDERGRARAEIDFNKRYPDAARIGVGFDYLAAPAAPAPSRKAVDDFNRLYPDAARIGTG
jgi:hypothetical protein